MARKMILVQVPHPFRWLRYFCKALLYGPSYSVYDDMRAKYEAPGDGRGSAKAPRLQDDGGGYSDKDDESYYGMT